MQKYEYCPIKINICQTSAANPDISLQKKCTYGFMIVNGNFTSLGKLQYCWPVFNAFVFFGMFAAVQISASFASKTERMNLKFWGGCSFFVYAVHFLYSPHLMKGLGYLWQPNSDLGFEVVD